MRNKLFSLLLVLPILFSFSFTVFADEVTTSAISEPTSVSSTSAQSDGTLIEKLEHIDKHLDFFTTVTALVLVVFVIVVLWFLFGRWFFRY